MKINKYLFELTMAKKCISSEELSTQTGISNITITRIKNGIQEARPSTVGKIARALNVDVEELIENTAATVNQKNDGKWLCTEYHFCKCSNCHWVEDKQFTKRNILYMKYCSNCGARMCGDEN